MPSPVTSLAFFDRLIWLDGRPMLSTIEEYRRRLFTSALDTFDDDGLPTYSLVLSGRGKKNNKTLDLVLAAFYKLLIPVTMQGNNGFLIANDEDQSADDLDLAKKLIACNSILQSALSVYKTEIRRKDGRGTLKILPALHIAGLHGKSGNFLGYDEIHAYKTYDQIEALSPDPHRHDVLTWITSYQGLYTQPGIPIVDYFNAGKACTDPRMLFSWYSGSYCTDPDFSDLPTPEQKANPSMQSWVGGARYLEQQKRRLPSSKYRRLHLNEPGSPNGAYFSQDAILRAVVTGRRSLPYREGVKYFAAVDMSGGSNDNSVLCICHLENDRAVVDLVEKQAGAVNPVKAVRQFSTRLHEYHIGTAYGDKYAGETFAFRFKEEDIEFYPVSSSASDHYERFEVRLNAGEIDLIDMPEMIEEFLGLVVRGTKITHESNSHDDHAAAVALAVITALEYDRNRVSWIMTSVGWNQGDTPAKFKSSLDYASKDPDELNVITDAAEYARMAAIRNTVRINGAPLSWREIREKVRHERELGAI
jgi:hypothetical protein